ncbi:7517_t:CDS:2, partial [Funneliformis caledonium]
MLFIFMISHGDQAVHIKISRRHWYDDNKWINKSKPPEDASKWAISQYFHTFDDGEN